MTLIIGLLLVIFLSLRQFSSTFVKKIKFQIVYQSYCKDHLHIRGENHTPPLLDQRFSGSPPHTWRKHLETSVYFDNYRITSTYVEKTVSALHVLRWNQDHLHIRGENCTSLSVFTTNLRITSTYVEKTSLGIATFASRQDHLHIRGENFLFSYVPSPSRGSPPHTWRKLHQP